MVRKTVKMNPDDINNLPENKPVIYKLLDNQGENIYTGSAKRGNVRERIKDLFQSIKIRFQVVIRYVEQMPSIKDSKQKEKNIISRVKPKHNKKGK